MYLTVAYEISDSSVTITVYNLSDNSVEINAASMTEIGSTGTYKYNFSGYSSGEDYAYISDAGSGQGDNRYRSGTKLNINQYVVAAYDITGLSPTVDVYDLSDNTLMVNNAAMSEIASSGMYKYLFSGADVTKDYLFIADAGSDQGDYRYKYGVSTLGLTGTISSRLTAIRAGVYTLGKTVTGLSASNLYFGRTKYGQQSMFCRFFGVDNTPTVDSMTEIEQDRFQFDFYGTNLANLETLVASHRAVFNRTQSLSVSNYSIVSCDLVLERPAIKEGKYWHIVNDYLIKTEKAR